MRFHLVIRIVDTDQRKFGLFLENLDTMYREQQQVLLAKGNSIAFLQEKSKTIFNCSLQWCNGDDPEYDSTEYFDL